MYAGHGFGFDPYGFGSDSYSFGPTNSYSSSAYLSPEHSFFPANSSASFGGGDAFTSSRSEKGVDTQSDDRGRFDPAARSHQFPPPKSAFAGAHPFMPEAPPFVPHYQSASNFQRQLVGIIENLQVTVDINVDHKHNVAPFVRAALNAPKT